MPDIKREFKTCADSKNSELIWDHISWACGYIANHLGAESLLTIILAGSLATGEGSVSISNSGEVSILSDLDLYIIAKEDAWIESLNGSVKHRFRYKNNTLNAELNSERPPQLVNPIDTIILTQNEIQKWWTTPLIVTLQLSGSARIIWGDSNVISDSHQYSTRQISDQDIFKLIFNRIAEQIFYYVRYTDGRDDAECLAYHCAKCCVDAVMAVGISLDEYKPGLQERLQVFENYCKQSDLGMKIADWAKFWTNYKLSPDFYNICRRFNQADVHISVNQAWDEVAENMLIIFCWLVENRINFKSANIENTVRFIAKKFTRYGEPELNYELMLFQPKIFLRQLKRKSSFYRINHFTHEMVSKNLPLPSKSKIRKLVRMGAPRYLVYSTAILLLSARFGNDARKKELINLANNTLPSDASMQGDTLLECWNHLAIQTATSWNKLVLDGRR